MFASSMSFLGRRGCGGFRIPFRVVALAVPFKQGNLIDEEKTE
jgi:hypothetical protein